MNNPWYLDELKRKDKHIAYLEAENKDLDESLTIAYMQGYSDGKAKQPKERKNDD